MDDTLSYSIWARVVPAARSNRPAKTGRIADLIVSVMWTRWVLALRKHYWHTVGHYHKFKVIFPSLGVASMQDYCRNAGTCKIKCSKIFAGKDFGIWTTDHDK